MKLIRSLYVSYLRGRNLENRLGASPRGFESHRLRQILNGRRKKASKARLLRFGESQETEFCDKFATNAREASIQTVRLNGLTVLFCHKYEP